jgi:hypothetical protein
VTRWRRWRRSGHLETCGRMTASIWPTARGTVGGPITSESPVIRSNRIQAKTALARVYAEIADDCQQKVVGSSPISRFVESPLCERIFSLPPLARPSDVAGNGWVTGCAEASCGRKASGETSLLRLGSRTELELLTFCVRDRRSFVRRCADPKRHARALVLARPDRTTTITQCPTRPRSSPWWSRPVRRSSSAVLTAASQAWPLLARRGRR